METTQVLECPTSLQMTHLWSFQVPDYHQQLHSFSMLLILLLKITFSSKLPPN